MQMLGSRGDSGGASYDGASAPDDFNQAPSRAPEAKPAAAAPASAPAAGGAAFDNFDDDIPF